MEALPSRIAGLRFFVAENPPYPPAFEKIVLEEEEEGADRRRLRLRFRLERMARLHRDRPLAATANARSAASRMARLRGRDAVEQRTWRRAWRSLDEYIFCCNSVRHFLRKG